jgi:hypothetical protein
VNLTLLIEYLRHADLLAQNSCNCHIFLSPSCLRNFRSH